MDSFNKLCQIIAQKSLEYHLDEGGKKRVKEELQEVVNQGEADYFIDLYEAGKKFDKNENNLIIPYLLGIVSDFDASLPSVYIYGEFPDIDVDYIPVVRDYLKNEWAPKTFGAENVCSIGNYTTFGIKSALIDMVRLYSLDRTEILKLTTKLPTKDEDGKEMTWDKAMSSSKELAAYCQQHPEVAEGAKRLVGRNRGKGKHAAGLVISKSRIDELVPLITDTDGTPISAWSEGLHTQDLQPVGLVKFDLLVITNLMQISLCTRLIKERRGLTGICNLPNMPDWSDDSFLNDPESLALAYNGKLKCVFQFDSDGIRELARRSKISRFEDLVAITALFRPGPLGMKMDDHFVKRKNGDEDYAIHPLMQPALQKTYGVMAYQEQVMRILNIVGKIPLTDCEKVRKAISKKKEDIISKYRPQFVENGVKTLGWDVEAVQQLWEQIVAFAEYGFNKSHAVCYTVISSMLLYLKAHFPLEFFASILMCEDDTDKIREYRIEAERFNIKVHPIDINKSGQKFEIRDNAIYIGFANVKGVGTEIAAKIVAGQPYNSFEDFLIRFGTDASVIKPLVGLRVFNEASPVVLYEFYEYFKNITKKRQERDKRHIESRNKYASEFRYLLRECGYPVNLEDTNFIQENQYALELMKRPEEEWTFEQYPNINIKQAKDVIKKYRTCVDRYQKKVAQDLPVTFKGFQPTGNISEKPLQELYEADPAEAERQYYGFGWVHPIQKSPDYKGDHTFEQHQQKWEANRSIVPVEAWIIEKPKLTKAKNSDKTYYVFKLEDENYRQESVSMWHDDYEIFKDILDYWESDQKKGNLISIRLQYPTGGFKRYSFDTPQRHKRRELPPPELDGRILLMQRPPEELQKAEVTSKLKELMLD